MHERPVLGQVVRSKAGRDQGKPFLVVGVIDDSYVELTDGDIRPVKNPKKKNVRHLVLTSTIKEHVAEAVISGKKLTNEQVREELAAFQVDSSG